MIRMLIILFLSSLFGGCSSAYIQKEVKIAFMADVHFADVYPDTVDFGSEVFTDTRDGKNVLIRTMESQLHSTRLFNENYFAFRAALDDAIKRGVKIIAMPGDISDDGQPMHIKGLRKIMDDYVRQYDISFFVINGNHDPTSPYGKEGGKTDFLGRNGRAQPIVSKEGVHVSRSDFENEVVVSKEITEWGYDKIIEELHQYGFFPNKDHIYWQTPFSTYTYEEYSLEKAEVASKKEKRVYFHGDTDIKIPDVSYLVEPVKGVWLLALDANVYIPRSDHVFNNAGIGYNEVLEHKKHLVTWTKNIVGEAKRLGKTLIAFSHYPMVDFNDGASEEMKHLFGDKGFQAHRIPNKLVGETFADLGLRVHVGGHMHLNDTGIVTTIAGNTLVNIQTPSLAAYVPGYKIITINNEDELKVKTIALKSVPEFKTFFRLYGKEHKFLRADFPDRAWDKSILDSRSYIDFTNNHLKELVRWRFLPKDWPVGLKDSLVGKTGWQLLQFANTSSNSDNGREWPLFTEKELLKRMHGTGLTKTDFDNWKGEDMILDFYRFRSADQLALEDIDDFKIKAYEFISSLLDKNNKNKNLRSLRRFMSIFQKQMHGEESMDFTVILE